MMIPMGLSDDEIRRLALEEKKTAEFLAGRDIKKVIVVKGRLVNIVAGG